jgi:hypothetical protein
MCFSIILGSRWAIEKTGRQKLQYLLAIFVAGAGLAPNLRVLDRTQIEH